MSDTVFNTRYAFEQAMLPQFFFQDPMSVISGIIRDPKILFQVLDTMFQEDQVENPYQEEDFSVDSSRITDEIFTVEIKLPEPEAAPLCHRVILFFDESMTNLGYYCLEKGDSIGGQDPIFVCGRDRDGGHLNFGISPSMEDAFVVCGEDYLSRFYSEQAK